jgi:hypothetical protein
MGMITVECSIVIMSLPEGRAMLMGLDASGVLRLVEFNGLSGESFILQGRESGFLDIFQKWGLLVRSHYFLRSYNGCNIHGGMLMLYTFQSFA